MDNIKIPGSYNYYINQKSINDFLDIFENKGGSLNQIVLYQKPHLYQKLNKNIGGGFVSFIKNIAKQTLPFITKYIFPKICTFTSNLFSTVNQNNE